MPSSEVEAIAAEGYIYGLPLIMSFKTLYHYALNEEGPEFKAPLNELRNTTRVNGPMDVALVSPNTDSLFSLLWMDLRAEPIVLCVPEIDERRYYSVQLQDLSTYNFGYIGSRTTGNGPGCFLVAGPNWRGAVPAGVRDVFRSGADIARAVYCPQLFNAADLPNVRRIQAGYRVQLLSEFVGASPPSASDVDFPAWDEDAATGVDFIRYLNFLLQFVSPDANERALWDRLARIGVGPGEDFDFSELSAEDQEAIGGGVDSATALIREESRTVAMSGDDREGYDGDWLRRAAVTFVGWGANSTKEAQYPIYRTDEDGDVLDTSRHRYTLRFEHDELPPVRAFWSVTMYDAESQLLVDNPIDRYVINSAMLPQLQTGADGSLTLSIQHDSPGRGRESNWLPAPDGELYILLRLYWPSDAILDGTWRKPEVQKAP